MTSDIQGPKQKECFVPELYGSANGSDDEFRGLECKIILFEGRLQSFLGRHLGWWAGGVGRPFALERKDATPDRK
jgi:hypothetical protein